MQWSRIQARWKNTPDQSFPMAEEELDGWKEGFEVPDADELEYLTVLTGVCGDITHS